MYCYVDASFMMISLILINEKFSTQHILPEVPVIAEFPNRMHMKWLVHYVTFN